MSAWPTAAAIDAYLARVAQANGRPSPLSGEQFIALGMKHGVNPAGIVAICQRETHLGTDGSPNAAHNNFGNLVARGLSNESGARWITDRWFADYATPAIGLEAIFSRFTLPDYMAARQIGTMEAVMAVYAPPSENDWTVMFGEFAVVGDALGVPIDRTFRLIEPMEGSMALTKYPVLMADGSYIQVESLVPIKQAIISPAQTMQRPGYAMWEPRSSWRWLQHETGNPRPGMDALAHVNFLRNGAKDSQGNPQYLSFHFVVDDGVIYQCIPLGEVTWQAADGYGPGNYRCISCEMCINSDGDKTKTRHNTEALAGSVLKALQLPIGEATVDRHWDYNWLECCSGPCDVQCGNRHHCPDLMMSEGYWPTFVANAIKYAAGSAPKPTEYAKPDVPDFMTDEELAKGWDRVLGNTTLFACRRLWEVKTKTARRQYADGRSAMIGPYLNPGDQFLGEFVCKVANGSWWIVTRYGTRIAMAAMTEQVRVSQTT